MHRRTVAGASAKNEIKVAIKLHIPFKICVFFFKDLFFVFGGFACLCGPHVCSACRGQERASYPPRTGVTGGCEPPCECWEQNSGPLQEHQVLLS